MPISNDRRRFQLSLFVPPPLAQTLEELRGRLDPVQFHLIPAHVTLCREDELDDTILARLMSGPRAFETGPVTLGFGLPESFHVHGILLPCTAGEEGYHSLRQWILGDRAVNRPQPHITLAHPRNPKTPANTGPSSVVGLSSEIRITFTSVSLIRQDGSAPWRVVESFALVESLVARNPAISLHD
jgi:2'-5' RNA ligase